MIINRLKVSVWLFTLMTFLMCVSFALGMYTEEFDYLLDVHRDWQTPHVAWGKPYAHGKPDVLYICPKIGAPREMVELAQRIDLNFKVFVTDTGIHLGVQDIQSDHFGYQVVNLRQEQRQKALAQELKKKWDVIILGHVRMSAIPDSLQSLLFEKVRAGTGLVIIYDETPLPAALGASPINDSDTLLCGIPYQQNPGYIACRSYLPKEERNRPLLRLYAAGKGRVAVVDYGYFYSFSSGFNGGAYGLTPWVFQFPNMLVGTGQASQIGTTSMQGYFSPVKDDPLYHKKFPRYDWTFPVDYEHALMLPARAILWAGKTTQPTVRFVKAPKKVTIDQSRPKASILYLLQADKKTDITVRYTFRWETGEVLSEGKLDNITVGQTPTSMKVPLDTSLPAGKAFCELQVVSTDGVEAWVATPLTIRGPATAKIASLDGTKFRPNETVRATITATPRAIGNKLILSGWDTDRREILKTQPVTITKETQTVSFVVPNTQTMAMVLRAWLFDDAGKLLSRAPDRMIPINLEQDRRDNFPVIIYDMEMGGYLEALISEQMRAVGVNAEYSYPGAEHDEDSLLWDMIPVPIVGESKGFNQFNIGNEEIQQRQVDFLARRAAYLGRLPILTYNHGNEYNLARDGGGFDHGTDEHWHRRFIEFLKAKYKSINTLNKAWNTQYDTFDSIEPVSFKEAQDSKQPAVILERWAFLQNQWAQFIDDAQKAVKRTDPGAYVGWEGIGADYADQWCSWRGMSGLTDMWGVYQQNECDLAAGLLYRSFVPDRVLTGIWWGGYLPMRDQSSLGFILWNHVVRGTNAMYLYHTFGAEGMWGSDFTPSRHLRLQQEDLKRIVTEIGPLFGKSHWKPDPIAVYWSIPSDIGRRIHGGRDIRWNGRHCLVHALQHAGFAPSFVDEKSDLDPKTYKAIFLTDAQFLSLEEAEKLSKYVRRGGRLISDVPPASCNELGIAYDNPPLDKLFGIRRDRNTLPPGIVQPVPTNLNINTAINRRPVRLNLLETEPEAEKPTAIDGVIVASYAKARGHTSPSKTPVLITNSVDNGQTILLNFTFDTYMGSSDLVPYTPLGTECELRRSFQWTEAGIRFLTDLLGSIGISPEVSIRADRQPIKTIRHSLYQNGNDLLLGITCLPNQNKTMAQIMLPEKFHVVDLKNDKYIGYTKHYNVQLGPGYGAAYSLLRKAPEKPTVQLAKDTLRRGEILTLTITLPDQGCETNVLKLRGIGPDQKATSWIDRTFAIKQNTAKVTIPTAWNDPEGKYTIEVLDVASGRTAQTVFQLKD